MNNPNNLFNMMQTGGLTRTTGGTALARALQRQSDIERLERQQKREAKRQKRGGLFGSIGSLAGGLLGATIPGLGLVLGAGLGTALGKRAGEGLGAGKSRKYDREGTVFGQQAFKDVEQASRDYTRGMGERALMSGLRAALTAGFSKDGGIYGEKNPFRGGLSRSLGIGGDEFASKVTEQGLADNPFLAEQFDDVFDVIDGVPYKMTSEGELIPINIMGSLSEYTPKDVLANSISSINKVPQPSLSKSNLLERTFSKAKDYVGQLQNLGLARMYGIGGKSFAEDVTRQGILDNAGLLMGQDIDEFAFLDDVQEQPNMQAPLLEPSFSSPSISQVPVAGGSSLIGYNQPILENFEDGGFLKLRRGAYVPGDPESGFSGIPSGGSGDSGGGGGTPNMSPSAPLSPSAGSYTAFDVAEGAGYSLTPEQARLISDFDPSSIEGAKSQYQQNLLGMTGGMGLSSMGGGFGARTRAGQQALSSASEAIGDVTSEAETQYESSVLGQIADLVAGGTEIEVSDSVPIQPPSEPGKRGKMGERRKGVDGRDYYWTGFGWTPDGWTLN